MSARGYFAERARLSGEGRACPRDMSCQRPINHKGKCDASDPPVTARKPSAAQLAVIADVRAGLDPTRGILARHRGARSRTIASCIRAGWIVERMEPVLRATPAGREAVRR